MSYVFFWYASEKILKWSNQTVCYSIVLIYLIYVNFKIMSEISGWYDIGLCDQVRIDISVNKKMISKIHNGVS